MSGNYTHPRLLLSLVLALAAPDPLALVRRAADLWLSVSLRYEGLIRSENSRGESDFARWRFERGGEFGAAKFRIRFLDPDEFRDLTLLVDTAAAGGTRVWLFNPLSKRIRQVSPEVETARLFAAEFAAEDLAEPDPRRYSYHAAGKREEGGVTCELVEARLRSHPARHRFYWIDAATGLLARADLEADGKVLKRIYWRKWRRRGTHFFPDEVEMIDALRGSRVLVLPSEVDHAAKLSPDAFSPVRFAAAP